MTGVTSASYLLPVSSWGAVVMHALVVAVVLAMVTRE
jgi:hypothetical protein